MALTVAEARLWGERELAPEQRRDVAYLLRAAMGRDAAYVLAHGEEVLTDEVAPRFRAMIARRQAGEPVQYIVGTQEFWGLELQVTPAVLIPRPETEHIVEAVLARVSRDADLRIADVGTGSGAIAIALAKDLPSARIVATDISAAALRVAKKNAEQHRVGNRIEFVECDLLPVQLQNYFDVIASNPPYVAEADRETLAREVRDFEPAQALFAGADGREVYRRLIPVAKAALKPGGWLVMEMGAGQADTLRRVLAGWNGVEIKRDLAGIERVISARR
jgi:release factor glutamine methyltransferase